MKWEEEDDKDETHYFHLRNELRRLSTFEVKVTRELLRQHVAGSRWWCCSFKTQV